LGAVAPEIVKGLGAIPPGPVVVAAPLLTDQPAPRGDELAARVAQVIAGKIGGAARAHTKSETLASARAVAGKAGALVYVQVELAKGALRTTADLYPPMSNAWDRIRIPAPAALAHAFATAPIDAEIRAFFPPVVLEQASLHKSRHDEVDVLAAACGDLDGDGGMDLALVTRARVVVTHVRSGKVSIAKSAAWSALLPRAGVPLREPIGGALVRGPGELLVGTTDRGGVQLDANLVPAAVLTGIPVAIGGDGACARATADSSSFDGDVVTCAGGDHPAVLASPIAKKYDAYAQADIVQKDGTSRTAIAVREPGGKLRVKVGDQVTLIEGVGAQIAVGDLDMDGAPEIVTTNDAGDDVILVSTWTPQGMRPRAKLPASAGVRALAICPPEERGVPALVAIVGSETWIWR
jgi:hypothetical protein